MLGPEPSHGHVVDVSNAIPEATPFTIELLWQRIAGADRCALFLDYDGTLAPFHIDRMAAVPLPGTDDAIRSIAAGHATTVAIVSGRPVAEVLELLGDLGVTIVGAHGFEVRLPGGDTLAIPISPQQALIFDTAWSMARELLGDERVERKAASVAAHFRGLDPQAVAPIEERLEHDWRAAGTAELVEFRPFNGGLELRAAGRTKGTAIRELLATLPAATLPVFIGDDDTDEDAFNELAGRGIGVKVGRPDAVTAADLRIADPAAVLELLRAWPSRNGER